MITEEQPEWRGTATELIQQLHLEIQPNVLTRKLNVSIERLYVEHGIRYENSRGHSGRMIALMLQSSRKQEQENCNDKKRLMQTDI